MNPDLRRRVRVLLVRQRVEMCSWTVYTRTMDLRPAVVRHRAIARRLSLLPAWASTTHEFQTLRATATELTWVYTECCDVLHGRRAYAALLELQVAGWESSVQRAELVITEVMATH